MLFSVFSSVERTLIMKVSIALAAVYALILFVAASVQHFLLGTGVWDIGLFVQFSWLIGEGKINAISSLRDISPLQDHFSLLLLPLGLIYRFFPSPFSLIGLQSIALGCMPAVAGWIAWRRRICPELIWALLIAIVLSPYPFLINRGDFHPDVLAVPLMLIAISDVQRTQRNRYYWCLLLTLFAKNAQALFGFGLGMYACAKGKYRRGLITIIISLGWWFLATALSSQGGDHVAIRMGYLGDTKLEMMLTLLTRPWVVFGVVSVEQVFLYTLGLCLPFLLLLRKAAWPALLGCLPVYLTNVVSASGIQRELDHHYSIAIFVFLIAACLDCMPDLSVKASRIHRRILYLTILFSLVAFLGYARIAYFQSRYWPRLAEAQEFFQVSNKIGGDESVLTVSNYAVHLAGRELIEQIEKNKFENYSDFDVVVLPGIKASTNDSSGRLRRVKDVKLGLLVSRVLVGAKSEGYKCDSNGGYVTICRKQ